MAESSYTTTTNFGAMTTTFVPPDDCRPYLYTVMGGTTMGMWGSACVVEDGTASSTVRQTCFPGAYGAYLRTRERSALGLYSPGLVCPSGFTSACNVSRIQGQPAPTTVDKFSTPADLYIWLNLGEGETAVGCCNSGYVCDTVLPEVCKWPATVGDVLTGVIYDNDCKPTPISKHVAEDQFAGFGQRVLLVRKSTDGPVGKSTDEPVGKPTDGPVGGGLSSGSKIALGLGVPLAAIFTGTAIVFLFLRRRRSAAAAAGVAAPGDYEAKPELDGSSTAQKPSELYGTGEDPPVELDPDHMPDRTPELQGGCYPATELASPPPELGAGAASTTTELPSTQPAGEVDAGGMATHADTQAQAAGKAVEDAASAELWRWSEPFYSGGQQGQQTYSGGVDVPGQQTTHHGIPAANPGGMGALSQGTNQGYPRDLQQQGQQIDDGGLDVPGQQTPRHNIPDANSGVPTPSGGPSPGATGVHSPGSDQRDLSSLQQQEAQLEAQLARHREEIRLSELRAQEAQLEEQLARHRQLMRQAGAGR